MENVSAIKEYNENYRNARAIIKLEYEEAIILGNEQRTKESLENFYKLNLNYIEGLRDVSNRVRNMLKNTKNSEVKEILVEFVDSWEKRISDCTQKLDEFLDDIVPLAGLENLVN